MKKVTSLLCLIPASFLFLSALAQADDAMAATDTAASAPTAKQSKAAARKQAKANSKEAMDKFATLPKSDYAEACKELSAKMKAGTKGLSTAYQTYCTKSPT